MTLMRALRAVSLTEGCSFLILLFIAMPLKYGFGYELAVKYTGWAHGVLFILLGTLLLAAMCFRALPFKTACIAGIASLLPAGPFFADRLLQAHQETLGTPAP